MNYTIVNGELHHSDELYHYGVKGMRWGVRKARRGESKALGRAVKATSDKERNAALVEAKKYRAEANRLTKAHSDAKANKKHMRLNKDGSITEIQKGRNAAGSALKVVGGAAIGAVGATALCAAGLTFAVRYMIYDGASFASDLIRSR